MANSPKVTKFLNDHPEFKTNYKEIFNNIKHLKDEDFKAMGADAKAQIEKKTGSKIDITKVSGAVNLAKKLNEDEFLAVLAGDSENLPALQLSRGEMALLQGGSNAGWSFAAVLANPLLGAIVCRNIYEADKSGVTTSGTADGTKTVK